MSAVICDKASMAFPEILDVVVVKFPLLTRASLGGGQISTIAERQDFPDFLDS